MIWAAVAWSKKLPWLTPGITLCYGAAMTQGLVGKNIRRYRMNAGLTADDLAQMAGLSSVRMIETGKRNPRMSTLSAIAKALGVTIAELYTEPEDTSCVQGNTD